MGQAVETIFRRVVIAVHFGIMLKLSQLFACLIR